MVTATMQMLSPGVRRYPDARLERTSRGPAVVAHGTAEVLLPRDVIPLHDMDLRQLEEDLHQLVEHFRLIGTEPTEDAAGKRLLEHVRRYGWPELCQHGRGPYHPRRPEGRFGYTVRELAPAIDACPSRTSASGAPVVALRDVIAMINALDAAQDIHDAVRRSRAPRRDAYDDLVGWDHEFLLFRRVAALTARTTEDARTGKDRAAVVEFFAAARASADVGMIPYWRRRGNIHDRLVSTTLIGLYLQDAFDHLDDRGKVRCSICRRPVPTRRRSPTPGKKAYCDDQKCHRTRLRLNQAKSRARRKEQPDG